ncbi:hypothetical protein JOQ06_020907, partial [Pogonophryne albipinna]
MNGNALVEKTEARKCKIEALTAGYAHSSRILVRGLTAQQKVTTASLKASWVLAKHNRPFTDAEVFKEVMVTVLEELATDKSMDGVIASVKQVSLSARSAIRRIEALSDAVQGSVLCAKLSGELKEVMDKVMRVINFVRGTSSTQHRLFRQLVAESEEATHDDLLLHNDVRWLSKGKALDRFCALLDE